MRQFPHESASEALSECNNVLILRFAQSNKGLRFAHSLSVFGLAATLAAGILALASTVHAQPSYAVLHNFTGAPDDGAGPLAGLIQDADGTFYGTTHHGGSGSSCGGGCGTIFKMAPDGGGFTILHSFTVADGAHPYASLIQAPDGTLYGTTNEGGSGTRCGLGCGTIFKMSPDGSGFMMLHSFTGPDGALPYPSGLTQDADGTLYGTTGIFGPGGEGTVFKIAPDGSGFTILHSFTGSDGSEPAALIQDPDGTLYGTTAGGGSAGLGTIFKIAPDGSGFTTLHTFTNDGATPLGALIQSSDGTLYGTTFDGGPDDCSRIFKMAPDGSNFTTLHIFGCGSGESPFPYAGLIQAPDGTLYGTTFGWGGADHGTIFQIAPDGSGFMVLHSFSGTPDDGSGSRAVLFQGADGALYGTTGNGGTGDKGAIFRLNPGPQLLVRRQGAVSPATCEGNCQGTSGASDW